jgi:carbon storage regulator
VLVLTRRPNQSIVIGGGEIVVTVLEVRGDQIRLGIKAPRDVDVHRDEVWAELQKANRAAALTDRSAVGQLDRLRRERPPGPSSS